MTLAASAAGGTGAKCVKKQRFRSSNSLVVRPKGSFLIREKKRLLTNAKGLGILSRPKL